MINSDTVLNLSLFLSVVMSSVPQGLSCVNDFVNNVSCTWHGSPVAPGVNCSISGVKKTRIFKNNMKLSSQMM